MITAIACITAGVILAAAAVALPARRVYALAMTLSRPLVRFLLVADLGAAGSSAVLFARHRDGAGAVVLGLAVTSLLSGVVFLASRAGRGGAR